MSSELSVPGDVWSSLRIRNAGVDPIHVMFSNWTAGLSVLPGGEFVVSQQAPSTAFFEVDRVAADPRLADVFVHGRLGSVGTLTVDGRSSALPPLRHGPGPYGGTVRWPLPPRTAGDIGTRLNDDRSPHPRLVWRGDVVASAPQSWVTSTPEPGAVITIELHVDHIAIADAAEVRVTTPDEDSWWAAMAGPNDDAT